MELALPLQQTPLPGSSARPGDAGKQRNITFRCCLRQQLAEHLALKNDDEGTSCASAGSLSDDTSLGAAASFGAAASLAAGQARLSSAWAA